MGNERAQYGIGDLAGLAGATPRTIRYYVAQGLLPAPLGAGPAAHYTEDHLARLRLIRRLQRQHQPLSEIRLQLGSLGEVEVARLLDDEEPEPAPASSALDYVRSVLAPESAALRTEAVPPPAASMASPLGAPGAGASGLQAAMPSPPLRAAEAAAAYPPGVAQGVPPAPPFAPAATAASAGEQRSQWDRIALTPNVEIHVRRPLGRLENRRVERLITIARQVLREEQP